MSDQVASQQVDNPTNTEIGQSEEAWIDVPESKLEELNKYMQDVIWRSVDAKQAMDDKIVVWEQAYEAMPVEPNKDWPWEGCSNLVVPAIATSVESILARIMGSIFVGTDLYQGMAKSPKWVDLVDPMEHFLNWVAHDQMDIYDACQRWFIGMLKFGTGIAKLPWERVVRKIKYKMPDGTVHVELAERYNGPKLYVVPISDFYISPDCYVTLDIQNCDGLFQRCVYSKKALEEKARSGIFKNVDKVLQSPRAQGTTMEDQKDRAMSINRVHREGEYETWECWVSYPIDEEETGTDSEGNPITVPKGELSELLIDYHYDTKTILRAVYNPYRHQERPFHFIRFMPREGSLWGIGLCQMLADIQIELSSEHNLRLDNAAISNSVAFKVKRNSHVDQIDIYPGAFVPFDEPDDIEPLEIGQSHDSLLREELHTSQLGEKRSGVSDYTVGRESSAIGSRATATSTLALIREGNKRFLMTINDIRKGLKNIGHQILMLYQQFNTNPEGPMYEIFDEKQKMIVQKYFAMPPEFTRANIAIDVPTLSEVENKDAKKQGYLTLMQMMATFYEKLFQAVQIAVNPQAPPQLKMLADDAAKGAVEMWKRVLAAFDFRDPETFAPRIEDILMMQSAMEQGAPGGGTAQEGNGGAAPDSGVVGGGPPMAAPSGLSGGGGAAGIEQLLESTGVSRNGAGISPLG